ncbi:MAG: T9SS type A sorting domain-containing protein, partial [Bacteroidales bacterium]|nr:T9SS type A sorting domain-containing protein [Bacteroidales bacterium]
EYGDVTAVHDIQQTTDGGYILIGDTKKLDAWYDPFVMKLNYCGEKEWCKILHLPNNMDFGTRILQLPNGNYIALLTYFSYVYSERIWLMCFDEAGSILWKKVYAQTEPDIINEDGFHLLLTADNSVLITGIGSYPDPDTNLYRNRVLLIKIDFDGNEKWTLPWGYTQYFKGHGVMSVEDNQGNIYTAGRHIRNQPNYGHSFTMVKTSKYGEEILYCDAYDSTDLGLATTISWLGDSTLAIGAGWRFPDEEIIEGIIKIDTLGNVLLIKEVIEADNTFQGSITTFDKKLLIMGGFYFGGNWDIYAYKFNQDLEYDTIYTQPFVYDSLCPYPIVSDTIPLDCEVVGLEEERKVEERPQLTIIPNPAKDKIRVVLPEHIITHTKAAGFNVTTWRYQFNGEIQLEIYDMYGRRWHQQVVAKGDKEAEIPVSSLPTGLYVVRAVIDGKVVSGKFVKQ